MKADEERARGALTQACQTGDRPACEAMVAKGWAKRNDEQKQKTP